MTGVDEEDDYTLAICIRCAQRFRASLSACPYCEDLTVTIVEHSEEAFWGFVVYSSKAVPSALIRLGGFPSSAFAQGQAHEFVRRYVAERLFRRET